MKIIESTKAYLGQRSIRTFLKSNTREVAACNIKEAKTIGILFNATHQISFEIVKAFVKDLSMKKKAVDILGFVDSKQLIDHYLYRKGFDFFTRSQLNWYYKPIVPNVEKFIVKPFDLLIDLSLDDPFPIHYIIACSLAKFKVGRYYEGQECLDFMIDMEKEKAAISPHDPTLRPSIAAPCAWAQSSITTRSCSRARAPIPDMSAGQPAR